MAINERLLDERLAQLEKAKGWSPRLISKLEGLIRSGDERALYRINPFTFARDKNAPEGEVIDLFLYATAHGLFGMDWLLICPGCACVVENFRSLKHVHNEYHCSFCQADHEAALDEFIAVTFSVSPEVRAIAYHRPDTLPVRDYVIAVCHTPDGVLPDGKPFAVVKAETAHAVSYLPPGGTTRLDVEVGGGKLLVASPEGRASLHFSVGGAHAPGVQVAPVVYGSGTPAQGTLAPGKVAFEVQNVTAERGAIVIGPIPDDMPQIRFLPFLTGKHLLTTQAFRDLFRTEVIRASEGIAVRELAILFTDLKGSTALYDRIGDLNAFSLVQQHFEKLHDVTVRHQGAIVKTIGDAVMATFRKPADAVAAALEMRAAIAASNKGRADRELVLKIGIHAGAAIAVTLNDRLDYFGQTVNIAARVQNLADADEIYVSEDVHAAEGVKDVLTPLGCESKLTKVKGVRQDLRVFCVPPASARDL